MCCLNNKNFNIGIPPCKLENHEDINVVIAKIKKLRLEQKAALVNTNMQNVPNIVNNEVKYESFEDYKNKFDEQSCGIKFLVFLNWILRYMFLIILIFLLNGSIIIGYLTLNPPIIIEP